MRLSIPVLTLSAALLATPMLSPATAADWPQFRGPNNNGISLEDGWSPSNMKIAWRAEVGMGASAVSVADGMVFTLGNKRGQDEIAAYDAATGKLKWKHNYPCSTNNAKYGYKGGSNASPTIHDGRVYSLSQEGHLFCLDAKTGKVIWNVKLSDIGARVPDFGFASSPVIENEKLIIESGSRSGSTLALNKDDASVVWRSGAHGPAYSSAVVANLPKGRQLLMLKAQQLVSINPKSGEELWAYRWRTSFDLNNSSAVLVDNNKKVYISTGYGSGCVMLDVTGNEPKQVWRNKNLSSQMTPPVHLNGYIYGCDGDVGKRAAIVCQSAETGEIVWRTEALGLGSLIVADGKLVIQAEKGDLVIAEASPDGFEQLGRISVLPNKISWVAPVLANGRIYCRSNDGALVCVDATGK